MKQVAVSDGFFSCGITASDGAVCWGWGREGQLGNGSNVDSASPVQVQGLELGVQSIAVGDTHVCAVTTGGAAKCWGENVAGQLGNNTTQNSSVPVDVQGLQSGVTAVSARFWYSCAVANGSVQCWGQNAFGSLGDGSYTDSLIPVQVIGLSDVTKVVAGVFHARALTTLGDVHCWGDNTNRQLGDGSAVFDSNVPVQVQGLGGTASDIVVGDYSTCALVSGAVKCWGRGARLGIPGAPDSAVPVTVPGLDSAVTGIYGGAGFCAEKADGTWWCWGTVNASGQAGTGDIEDATAPRHAVLLDGAVESVSLAGPYACAVLANGQGAACWGNNAAGQLGNGKFGYERDALPVFIDVAGCDVVFDATDVLAVLNALTGSETGPQPDAPCDADVDNDGETGIADALLLRQILASTIP
jgi:alpha-tubulin suppressor-like RCC1 family protein